jgi:hypothetical protein
MQIAFFSECPKTLVSKQKVHFIHQGIKKCNFYFAFFCIFLHFFAFLRLYYIFRSFFYIFSAFLWVLSHFFNIHSKKIKIPKYFCYEITKNPH